MSKSMNRRQFLAGGTAAAVTVPSLVASSLRGMKAPSGRILMGCIGVGGRGRGDMRAFLNDPRVQVMAVCDTDRHRAESAAKNVDAFYAKAKKSGQAAGCVWTQDFQEIIARRDIDAVLVATPDHTHALITIQAARAGKDIYCEKPLAYSVAEGRAVVQAVQRYGRVLQTGTQRRSNGRIRHACELVRNGRIGRLTRVRVGLPRGFQIRNGARADNQPEEKVPEWFDFDKWLGPAPLAPYTPGRCHFNFRWILDYGEGYISDWGAHYLDVAHWGMGADGSGPETVQAKATFPQDGLYDAPTDFHIEYGYADGVELLCSTEETLGIRFEGSRGWIHIERPRSSTVVAHDERILKSQIGPGGIRLYRSRSQHMNFIDCVLSRRQPAAPAEIGHRSASVCHIGMIAARLGSRLTWDAKLERFPDAPEANRLLSRPMRSPWTI